MEHKINDDNITVFNDCLIEVCNEVGNVDDFSFGNLEVKKEVQVGDNQVHVDNLVDYKVNDNYIFEDNIY